MPHQDNQVRKQIKRRKVNVVATAASANELSAGVDEELSAMAQGIQSWLDSFPKPSQSVDDQPLVIGNNPLPLE